MYLLLTLFDQRVSIYICKLFLKCTKSTHTPNIHNYLCMFWETAKSSHIFCRWCPHLFWTLPSWVIKMQFHNHQTDRLLVEVNAPMQVHPRVQHKHIVTFVATQIPQGLTQSLLSLLKSWTATTTPLSASLAFNPQIWLLLLNAQMHATHKDLR